MASTGNNKRNSTNGELASNGDEAAEEVDYDTVLVAAGEFGLYQALLFVSTCPFYIFGVFMYFSQLFMTEVSPNHWCWIPELENLTDIERRNLAIPLDKNSHFGYSQCEAYVANWTEVLATGQKPNGNWTTQACQYGWEFNKTEIPYPTISSELGWVCDKSSYQATAQSIFFVGSIVGGFIVGWISDKFGRLPAAVAANMIGCVAGVVSTFASSFLGFAICRFFVGMSYDNCMIMTYLLVLEYTAPKYRTLMTNLSFAIFYTLGLTTLPWIALACGHWKTISLATSIPLALSLIAPFVMPESPRWLLVKGRVDDTVKKIQSIARINKKEVPAKLIEQFRKRASKETEVKSGSIMDIMKSSVLRRTFVCLCIEYMCCMIVFDALIRTVGQLKFDYFVSFTIMSFTELPSLVLISFILDLTGRKWLSIVTLGLCCIFSFAIAFVPNGLPSVVCAVVARFAVNMSANTAMMWGAEMLPTTVRGSGMSIVHICGYIATVISPFIAYLGEFVDWLPLILIGCLSALGVVVCFVLPETAHKEMPQSIQDAEVLVKNDKLWDFSHLRKPAKNSSGEVNASFEMS